MIKKFAICLAIFVAVILTLAAYKSPTMYVSRNIQITASPELLFPYINSSQKSYEWMPWADKEAGLKISFSGPTEGIGARSHWDGEEMGTGSSEVVESVPNKLVRTKLEYTKPFSMSQLAEISLSPTSDGTLVIWSVSGQMNYFFRIVSVFVDCQSVIGEEFDKGLSKLKKITENTH